MEKLRRLPLFFLAIGMLSLGHFLWVNRDQYTTPYDHAFFSRIYSNSPYVKGQLASEGIGDDGLYAFAGYYYIRAGDISQVNFENPPLGKYLIGLSIQAFGNQNVINLLYAVLIFISFYFLCFHTFKSHTWSTFALSIMMLDPFFLSQLRLSLLDLPLTMFILLGMLFYLLAISHSVRLFWLSSLFFSLALVTKFFPGSLFFLVIMSLYIFKKHKKKINVFISSLTLLPFVYLVSHWSYFYHHPSLIEFLRYQKWVLAWRLGNPVVYGNILTALLIGRYRSWWGETQWLVDKEWSPLIAILTSGALLSIFFKSAETQVVRLLYMISLLYLIYTLMGTVGYAKYILPVYPFFVLLCTHLIRCLLLRIKPFRTL